MTTVDVTPVMGETMAGYGDRGASTGVLDPICAVVTLVEGAAGRVCLIALDALGVRVSVATRLREAVGQAVGVSAQAVVLSCTHNHASPDWFDQDSAAIESADRMICRVAAAAQDLAQHLQDVGVSFALTTTAMGVNRRVDGLDGRAVMGTDPDGPVDRRVGTLVFTSTDGEVVGTVTVAAAHANCLKGDNTCLSADFVGAFRDHVSTRTGAPAMFVQGAAGDINPARRGNRDDALRTGVQLGDDTVSSLAGAEPLAEYCAVVTREIRVPLGDMPDRQQAERIAATAGSEWGQSVDDWLAWHATAIKEPGRRAVAADLSVVRIGDVYIGGVPWELFSQTALDVAESHGPRAFLCGYINGYYGYLAPAEEQLRGGYEVEWMPILYGLGTDMPLPMSREAAHIVQREFMSSMLRLSN